MKLKVQISSVAFSTALLLTHSLFIQVADAQNTTQAECLSELSAQERNELRVTHSANLHRIKKTALGFSANNPRQSWNLEFDGRSFLIAPTLGDWNWGLNLENFGFPCAAIEISNQPVSNSIGSRVEYEWGHGLQEWFINDERGLEHGFVIRNRPLHGDCADLGAHESIELNLNVRGGLLPRLAFGGRDVEFLDSEGHEVLRYAGLKVWDATGKPLNARFKLEPGSLRLTVDEAGAVYPITVDPVAQQRYLKSPNPDAGDLFGRAVSISADTVAVGAPGESSVATGVDGDSADNSLNASGAVFIYVRQGSNWVQQAYLKAAHTDAGDQFGSTVSLSGDRLAVGAIGEDSGGFPGVPNGSPTNNSAQESGAAYVFVRNAGVWSQEAYIKPALIRRLSQFGEALVLEGDRLIVGSSYDPTDPSFGGEVRVFERAGSDWNETQVLTPIVNDGEDRFGWSLAMHGDRIVVGSIWEDSKSTDIDGNKMNNQAADAGAAYLFEYNGSSWIQDTYFKASNAQSGDLFGFSVGVLDDLIVVGAISERSSANGINGAQNNNTLESAGAAYVFALVNGQWTQEAYIKSSNSGLKDGFGAFIAMSENRVLIAARGEDSNATGVNGNEQDNSAQFSGAAYLFSRNGTTWLQEAYMKASNTNQSDQFAWTVGLDGQTAIVGAWGEASGFSLDESHNLAPDAGAAYIYDIPPALAGSVESLSLSSGGQQVLTLEAGEFGSSSFYWIFGSASGSLPGLNLGAGLELPLNFDSYTSFTINKPMAGIYSGFFGQLDAQGAATATLTIPPNTSPSFAGITLHHAYLGAENFGQPNFTSNAVSLLLTP